MGRLARKSLKFGIYDRLNTIDRNSDFLENCSGKPAFLPEQRRKHVEGSDCMVSGLCGRRLGVDHGLLNFNC